MGGEVVVGIDVSKARLDVAWVQGEEVFSEEHSPHSIAVLVERLTKLAPARIVLEASGGLENALVAELVAAELPAVVVNPRQVCDFARATGQLAKTDPLDARVLARFGERIQSSSSATSTRCLTGACTQGGGRRCALGHYQSSRTSKTAQSGLAPP
jgi:transposase